MTVSIIIPSFNLEQYIGELCSLLSSHSYEEFEYIFINDNSKDNTLKIIQSFAASDSRFIVINNKKNIGLSETREEGVKVSSKEYLCFLDGDDLIDLDTLLNQINQMKNCKSEAS